MEKDLTLLRNPANWMQAAAALVVVNLMKGMPDTENELVVVNELVRWETDVRVRKVLEAYHEGLRATVVGVPTDGGPVLAVENTPVLIGMKILVEIGWYGYLDKGHTCNAVAQVAGLLGKYVVFLQDTGDILGTGLKISEGTTVGELIDGVMKRLDEMQGRMYCVQDGEPAVSIAGIVAKAIEVPAPMEEQEVGKYLGRPMPPVTVTYVGEDKPAEKEPFDFETALVEDARMDYFNAFVRTAHDLDIPHKARLLLERATERDRNEFLNDCRGWARGQQWAIGAAKFAGAVNAWHKSSPDGQDYHVEC